MGKNIYIYIHTVIINTNYNYKWKKLCHVIRSLSIGSVKSTHYDGRNKGVTNYFHSFTSLNAAGRAASKLLFFL